MDDEQDGLSIGRLSELTGCLIETIRYYERIEILRAPPRTASGRRVYETSHVQQLLFIRRARDLDFSLDQIRTLLRLAGQDAACDDTRKLAGMHLEELQRRLAGLQRVIGQLQALVDQCPADGGTACPIIDWLAESRPNLEGKSS